MAWLAFDRCYCFKWCLNTGLNSQDWANGDPIFYLQHLAKASVKGSSRKHPKSWAWREHSKGIIMWIRTWLDPHICTFRNLSCAVSLLSSLSHKKGREAHPLTLRKPQESTVAAAGRVPFCCSVTKLCWTLCDPMEKFIPRQCCILKNGTKDPSFSLFKQSSCGRRSCYLYCRG